MDRSQPWFMTIAKILIQLSNQLLKHRQRKLIKATLLFTVAITIYMMAVTINS